MKDDEKKPDEAATEEDDIVEFEYNEDGEEDLKKTLKKLRADLKQAKKDKEEYLTGWQKERAEFANFRKQEEDRKAVFSEAVRERILTRFLSVADSFHLAFVNKEAWEKVDENWRRGIEHIYSQMQDVFEEYGVKPIGKEGEAFDPNIHQSMEVVETDQSSLDHTVATIVQQGYKLGERVIRPAKVNVYEFR